MFSTRASDIDGGVDDDPHIRSPCISLVKVDCMPIPARLSVSLWERPRKPLEKGSLKQGRAPPV
jgi:hypothetical protein